MTEIEAIAALAAALAHASHPPESGPLEVGVRHVDEAAAQWAALRVMGIALVRRPAPGLAPARRSDDSPRE